MPPHPHSSLSHSTMDDDNSSVYALCLSYSCMNDNLSHYSDTRLRFRMVTNACMHTRYYRFRRTLLSRLSSVLDELRSIGLPQQPLPPIRNGPAKVVHGSRRFLHVSVSHFVLADVCHRIHHTHAAGTTATAASSHARTLLHARPTTTWCVPSFPFLSFPCPTSSLSMFELRAHGLRLS